MVAIKRLYSPVNPLAVTHTVAYRVSNRHKNLVLTHSGSRRALHFMTIKQIKQVLSDFDDNVEVRVEFGIDHHVPIERIDEHHPEGAIGAKENYLLLILE
jgi:hypothetical protein